MKLTFLGATGTVTGSKYLLETAHKKILIDCGLYQGHKHLRERNWQTFPVDPKLIDAVLLTHAHIDHSGYLPCLVKNGFTGAIYSTPATKDLCEILLIDAGHLQEEEARLANKFGYSKHKIALPLYTKQDAINTLPLFHSVGLSDNIKIDDSLSFQFHQAGHILGAATLTVHHKKKAITFSGDLGRPNDPVMKAPVHIAGGDYLVLESTYGDRVHEVSDPKIDLAKVINDTAKRGGSIVIPSFAVGRTQALLYYLHELKKENAIPNLPVYLDSPMAINATKLFQHYHSTHRLSNHLSSEVCGAATYVNSVEESKWLDEQTSPMILISASGMATGGRILHHLKVFLPDARNTVLFAGYQAPGTRGDRLVRGESQIKIHGEMIPVNAQIERLHNVSAHADYSEMLEWLSHLQIEPKQVFITHGEAHAGQSLKEKIKEKFGWACITPAYLDEVNFRG